MDKRIGFVETPIEIANLMVEMSGVDRKVGTVLDTGCGRGVFLRALRNHGFRDVYGIEIDGELCAYCRNNFKDFKITLGNFLTHSFRHQFDLIIGNPPYVHFNSLPSEMANVVKRIIRTSEGDIYYAFIIRAVQLLKDGGELIYIVPYHFFYNTYAKVVRETLLKFGKIEVIIDMDEARLFNGENPETVILKFRKGKYDLRNERIEVLNIKTRKAPVSEISRRALEALNKKESNELFDYAIIPHYLDSEPWSSFAVDVPNFPSVRLKDIARVGVGLVSGFDKAFITNLREVRGFSSEEMRFVKKLVKGKHCRRFVVDGYDLYIVIDDSVRDENDLREKYPNVYRKILPFKTEMSKRYLPKGKRWFHWQALRNYRFLLSNLNKKRIYVPTLDRHPYNRFSLGEGHLLPSGDVLFIQPRDENDSYFLLGYLNSTFFRNYYLAKGGRRGGRVSFTQRLLENAGIPLFTDEVREKIALITKDIITKVENEDDTSSLEKDLDNVIHSSIYEQKFSKNFSGVARNTLFEYRPFGSI